MAFGQLWGVPADGRVMHESPSLLRRAARRVVRHRGEAAVVVGFLILVATVGALTGISSRVARLAAAGLVGSVITALATVWIPIAVIDFRRCTRETALRVQVQGDLERHQLEVRARQEEEHQIRTRVETILATGGPRIVYQPIVDMTGRTVVGYEALSRFENGTAPDRWFAEAARIGLGVELELAAVNRALDGLVLPDGAYVSVNAGPDVLADPRMLEMVSRVPPGCLVVELTEHLVMNEYDRYRGVFADLRAAGARLALDDVGSGYCGLRHIVELVPDVIKVDQSLVRGIHADPGRRNLMIALVSFARDFGATLVAEGVEDEQEATALQRWGVRFAQGWLYGRPGPLPAPGPPAARSVVRSG